jgi:hypothetical protein
MASSRLFASAIAKVLAFVLFAAPLGLSQTQNTVIEWPGKLRFKNVGKSSHVVQIMDDAEIEDVSVEGKSIIIGQPFGATDDWLKAVIVRIRNVSGHPFSTIQLNLSLPEIKGPDIPMCYGCAEAERRKGIMPGEEVELRSLGGPIYEWVKGSLEKNGISRISRAQISSTLVILRDGTQWTSECVKTANPQNACPAAAP